MCVCVWGGGGGAGTEGGRRGKIPYSRIANDKCITIKFVHEKQISVI